MGFWKELEGEVHDGEKTGRQEECEGRRAFTGWYEYGGEKEWRLGWEAFLAILCLKPIYLFIFISISCCD